MQELIEVIRAATASGASTEQKAAGVQACRTIISALDTVPGTPLLLPTSPTPVTRPSIDQVLDMMIAKLTSIVTPDAVGSRPAGAMQLSSTPIRRASRSSRSTGPCS